MPLTLQAFNTVIFIALVILNPSYLKLIIIITLNIKQKLYRCTTNLNSKKYYILLVR